MAQIPEYDIAILGGGLAGLSLAARLIGLTDRRILIVEPRMAYGRDRTWCYWRLLDHPFDRAVTARWHSWEVIGPGPTGNRTAVQRSASLPYEMIPADRLYGAALQLIGSASHIDLRLGSSATGLTEGVDHVTIETNAGPVTSRLVFDGRPPAGPRGGLLQRFLGQEIAVGRPVFDPDRVTLMDFSVPQLPGAVHFLYVLPTSSRTALVEDTWLCPAGFQLPDCRSSIRDYLSRRFAIEPAEILFEEEGAIPMDPGLQPPDRTGRIIPIGTAGGIVKPSSGYGFVGIQRMADAIARDVTAGRAPHAFRPRGRFVRWMDDLLLDTLTERSDQAPEIFGDLFARCRPEPLVRFLNELGTAGDVAEVIGATPKMPMLKAAARRIWNRHPNTQGSR